MAVYVQWLDLHYPIQSVYITTLVVSLIPTNGKKDLIQRYIIKFVTKMWQVCGFHQWERKDMDVNEHQSIQLYIYTQIKVKEQCFYSNKMTTTKYFSNSWFTALSFPNLINLPSSKCGLCFRRSLQVKPGLYLLPFGFLVRWRASWILDKSSNTNGLLGSSPYCKSEDEYCILFLFCWDDSG
jgi:hypothetical protein